MIPVILSGGSGVRLWPVSRSSFPKQFGDFFDKSLMCETAFRLQDLGNPLVLTVEPMKVLTQRILSDLGIDNCNAIYEPYARNTAPAIALLIFTLFKKGYENEIVGVFPADHLITDKLTFLSSVKLAEKIAKKNKIVTLGIRPEHAATGFGYIEIRPNEIELSENKLTGYKVEAFREKPNIQLANKFLNSGRHFWNAGIFVFKLSTMINAFERHKPDMWNNIKKFDGNLNNLQAVYDCLESISIDSAIMEKESNQVCIPVDIGWSDVGSWEELSKVHIKYNRELDSLAEVHEVNSKDNLIFSTNKKHVGLIGIENTVVVDTSDALLISKKDQSQLVKEIVDMVKSSGSSVADQHLFEFRPWGRYDILEERKTFKSKVIEVNPGQKLSYQSHEKRDEHWVIVQGEAEVILNDEILNLKLGDHIYIPRQCKHRIKNSTNEPMLFVEIQVGEYFGEDDIVRYQDDYDRT